MPSSLVRRGGAGILLTFVLVGCDRIPGTDANHIRSSKEQAAQSLIDPSSAQFRNVKINEAGTTICGEINGKNRMGAYTGFSRFHVAKEGLRIAYLDPEFDPQRLASLDQICRGMQQAELYVGGAGSTAQCEEADEYREVRKAQVEFDRLWWEQCYYDGQPQGAGTETGETEAEIPIVNVE